MSLLCTVCFRSKLSPIFVIGAGNYLLVVFVLLNWQNFIELPDLWGKPGHTRVTHQGYRTVCGYVAIMGMKIIGLLGSPLEKGNTAKTT